MIDKGERLMTNTQLKNKIDRVLYSIDEDEINDISINFDIDTNEEGSVLSCTVYINGDMEHDFTLIYNADEEYCNKELKKTKKYLINHFGNIVK